MLPVNGHPMTDHPSPPPPTPLTTGDRDKRTQPRRRIMELWRDRVASVLDFDPRRPVPLDPIRIVVIDRDYTDKNGRTVLNIRPVVKRMRRR